MPTPLHFIVPGALDTPTGGFVYDRRMVGELRAAGRQVAVTALDGEWPWPAAAVVAAAARAVATVPAGTVLVVDGLAFTALSGVLAPHAERLDIVALVHHPLADETGYDPATAAELLRAETAALRLARATIVTSRTTARRLADLGQPPERVRVVPPGVDPVVSARVREGLPETLLCVASLTRRKGHDVLLRALAECRDLPWRLDCVGPARDPDQAARVRRMAAELGLAGRVRFHGALDAASLAERYRAADLFVLASRHEGYGMVLAEAMAHGLPVLATAAGAIPEVVPGGAGLLVPPDDVPALSAALRRLLSTPGLAAGLAAGARSLRLPDWRNRAAAFAAAVDAVALR